MRAIFAAAAAAVVLAACTRDKVYESGGTTDTAIDSTADTTRGIHVPGIDVGSKVDTVTVPVIETRKDTIIVDKPVGVGKKQVEVKRPTVDKKP